MYSGSITLSSHHLSPQHATGELRPSPPPPSVDLGHPYSLVEMVKIRRWEGRCAVSGDSYAAMSEVIHVPENVSLVDVSAVPRALPTAPTIPPATPAPQLLPSPQEGLHKTCELIASSTRSHLVDSKNTALAPAAAAPACTDLKTEACR